MKYGRLKMRKWKNARVENAEVENAGADRRGGKCRNIDYSRMESRTGIIQQYSLKLLLKIVFRLLSE